MVRLVRLHADSDAVPAGLGTLAAAGPLDVLQIDYARPKAVPSLTDEPPELPELAASFPDALTHLCKSLFLEPDFRIITSAGWSNSYGGIERVAHALVAGGSPNLPVSAVRGSSVLGILDYLTAERLPLDNVDTGAPWRELRQPILAADLQLGAGPILGALEEGARVIMAGCYDGAAPAIASAIHACGWTWKEYDHLAGAAAAARAAIWPHRQSCMWVELSGALPATQVHPRIELESNGAFTVDVSQPCQSADAEQLAAWLQAGKARDPVLLHADVSVKAEGVSVEKCGPTQLRVAGCTGVKADDSWRLEVLYQAGFVAETMIEFTAGAAESLPRQVADAFRANFMSADDERSLVSVQELATPEGGTGAASWLHLVCRSKRRKPCVSFVDQVNRFAESNSGVARLPAGRPTVLAECGLWPARIPRGAVDLAIDTRPAREWE